MQLYCIKNNVAFALRHITSTKRRSTRVEPIDFLELCEFSKHHDISFHPLIAMQKNLRRATLGEFFWKRKVVHKARLQELVVCLRQTAGVLPPLTWLDWLLSPYTCELTLRKRAHELYTMEKRSMRHLVVKFVERTQGGDAPGGPAQRGGPQPPNTITTNTTNTNTNSHPTTASTGGDPPA